LDKLGLNLGYIFVQAGSFFLLLIILSAWVYKPILNMLEKRREAIAQGLEDAKVASEAKANAVKEADQIIADAQLKAAAVVNEAASRAEVAAKEIRSENEAVLAKDRAAMLEEVKAERDRVLSDLRGDVAAIAIAAAQKLIGETIDEKRQHALLNEFFSGVKSGKVVVLEGEMLAGSAAEVTSALPLTADEQQAINQDLFAQLGQSAEVNYKVDPSILGGVIIKVGDRVIDGSVSGQLQAMHQSLKS
jgi:F-type H+-transporting ATPase subunit b